MKKIILALSLMLFAGSAFSEQPEWFNQAIKQDNPNELAYVVGVYGDCLVTRNEVADIAEEVFARSRVKPLSEGAWASRELYLSIALNCYSLENNNPVFNYDLRFGRYNPKPMTLYDSGFSGVGINEKDGISQSLTSGVEDAITAYINANFNL